MSCDGCRTRFGDERHPDFVASPSCAIELLEGEKENLAAPCAVVEANVDGVTGKAFQFDLVGAKGKHVGKAKLDGSYTGEISGWSESAQKQRVWLQLYLLDGDFVLARVYDPIAKIVRLPKDRPKTKREEAGSEVEIGFAVAGIGLVWILLGVFWFFKSDD